MKLIHRMQILMAVVQELGGTLKASDFYGLLFLYCNEFVEHNHYYEFIPQENGPYSLQAEADKETLIKKKCLLPGDDWVAKADAERFAVPLDFFEKIAIQQLKNWWQDKDSTALAEHLQGKYPDYFKHTATVQSNDAAPVFYTIGYEGITPEAYLNKLLANNVKLLCDVRKNAFSQKYGFSKQELKSALEKVGIRYQHIPALGIVSEKRQSLNNDHDYIALFKEYERDTLSKQQENLNLLMKLLQDNKRIAITCFEAKPCYCHRGTIADNLKKRADFTYKVEHL